MAESAVLWIRSDMVKGTANSQDVQRYYKIDQI